MSEVVPQYRLDIDCICAYVAEGKSLAVFARHLRMRFGTVLLWIEEQPDRKKKYDRAITERERWCIEQILAEVQQIALADIRTLYNEEGNLLSPHEWPDSTAKAVSGLDVTAPKYDKDGNETTPEIKKIKLYDKLRALEAAGRQYSLFREKIDIHAHLTLEELVLQSIKPIERVEVETVDVPVLDTIPAPNNIPVNDTPVLAESDEVDF